jgi:hypothetical protein
VATIPSSALETHYAGHRFRSRLERAWFLNGSVGNGDEYGSKEAGFDGPSYEMDLDLVTTLYAIQSVGDPRTRRAYTAARKARFEHGERGR